ncbi:MAG: putative lipid II flippase FtsW [Lentisphaerales bacterium]|nr:putative lipid II flippase FtsW [Lentisphaerales bacterium]
MLYSTSGIDWRPEGPEIDNKALIRQLTFIAIGGFTAVFLHYFDYRTLCRMSRIFMGIIAVLLLYLAIANALKKNLPMVRSIKGAYRWIRFGSLSIQPSEFAKIAIILFMADYYHRFNRHSGTFLRGFLVPCIPVGIIGFLIIAGGSLSVTMITACMVMGLLFICGVRMRWLALVAAGGIGIFYSMINIFPERMRRVTSFMDPEAVAQGEGYQLWNSLLALGSGGPYGRGFTESRMKLEYLPEAHNDFILSIVGEELGFVGLCVVILLYLAFLYGSFKIAAEATDYRGMIVATGLGLGICLHGMVNIGVISGALPTTGVTAPFLSYGGSSMLSALISVGIIMSVARESERAKLEGAEEFEDTRYE